MAWIRIEGNKLEHTLARSGKDGMVFDQTPGVAYPTIPLRGPEIFAEAIKLAGEQAGSEHLGVVPGRGFQGYALRVSEKDLNRLRAIFNPTEVRPHYWLPQNGSLRASRQGPLDLPLRKKCRVPLMGS